MEWMQMLAMILGPTGAAFVGVKMSLNGLQRGQTRIFKCMDRIEGRLDDHVERIATLEAQE